MVINTNVSGLKAQINISRTNQTLNTSSARLSSGMMINSAADDAAGLAISEKMRANIRGLEKAEINVTDAISLFNIGDGALSTVDDMLIRMRELSIQALNDTYVDTDRQKMNDEFQQLINEVDMIADRTEFNTIKIFQGSSILITTGITSGRSIDSTAAQTQSQAVAAGSVVDGRFTFSDLNGTTFAYTFNINTYLEAISPGFLGTPAGTGFVADMYRNGVPVSDDDKRTFLDVVVASINAGIQSTIPDVTPSTNPPPSPPPRIAGAYDANGNVVLVNANDNDVILTGIGCSGMSGIGQGVDPADFLHGFLHSGLDFYSSEALLNEPLSIVDQRELWIQMGANAMQGETFRWNTLSANHLGLTGSNLNTLQTAKLALIQLDNALGYTTDIRTLFGTYTNRLEFCRTSLSKSAINVAEAESRIRDADMVKEMMSRTRSVVLQNAAMLVLAQANHAPETVLQLLR